MAILVFRDVNEPTSAKKTRTPWQHSDIGEVSLKELVLLTAIAGV